jgi:hypothetical protein
MTCAANPAAPGQLWVIRVGSGLSAFGGIADINSWGKVAMGQELPFLDHRRVAVGME